MTELATRILTAFAMIAVALLAAVVGGNAFALFVAAVATAMYYEWLRIVRGWGLAWSIGGFIYCLLPALALLWIRERSGGEGLSLLLWVFLVTWATDIGAYFAGRLIGGPKLAPSISPNKTIAGLLGGVVSAALLAGLWVSFINWDSSTPLPSILYWLSAPFAVAAQLGDLFESGLKRRAGVKDSGTWLPGHGGLLDRLDGLVPVAVLTAALMISGNP